MRGKSVGSWLRCPCTKPFKKAMSPSCANYWVVEAKRTNQTLKVGGRVLEYRLNGTLTAHTVRVQACLLFSLVHTQERPSWVGCSSNTKQTSMGEIAKGAVPSKWRQKEVISSSASCSSRRNCASSLAPSPFPLSSHEHFQWLGCVGRRLTLVSAQQTICRFRLSSEATGGGHGFEHQGE